MARILIDDVNDPRLDPFRDMKQPGKTRSQKWVISEGWRVTERLLKSRFKVTAVVMSERRTETYEGFVPEEVPLFVTNHAVV